MGETIMYYIEQDNKIVLFDEDRNKLEKTLSFMPQYSGLEIKETDRPIENFEFADTPEYIAKKNKEQIQSQIEQLEATITARNIRSAIQGDEYALNKINEVEEQIEELRKQLPKGE